MTIAPVGFGGGGPRAASHEGGAGRQTCCDPLRDCAHVHCSHIVAVLWGSLIGVIVMPSLLQADIQAIEFFRGIDGQSRNDGLVVAHNAGEAGHALP